MTNKYKNLIVIQTFSKWAGLAGLRLGYGVMHYELSTILNAIQQPYTITNYAIDAAMISLDDVEYLDITIGAGGNGCALVGDVNGDETLNILDVVLLVNLILGGSDAECGDANGDDATNILDVVLLVNIILAG